MRALSHYQIIYHVCGYAGIIGTYRWRQAGLSEFFKCRIFCRHDYGCWRHWIYYQAGLLEIFQPVKHRNRLAVAYQSNGQFLLGEKPAISISSHKIYRPKMPRSKAVHLPCPIGLGHGLRKTVTVYFDVLTCSTY